MADYIESLELLAEQFRRLPGVGKRSATRMAFAVLDLDEEEVKAFAQTIVEAKARIHYCPVCGNLTDRELCSVCSDENRDHSVICVVEDPKTVLAMEKVREFRGVYHVLHGVLSPSNGIGPEKLHLRELLERVHEDDVTEVILATNPTVEGDTTALYIAKLLKPLGITVSRLAYGIPVGGDLEYADEVTLYRALEGRRDYT
jgi:recombination protein RecR